ncbi:DUF1566 domain-containing protein [bacterium]|nr:DUF1566 domain-containing protein [bacterium]
MKNWIPNNIIKTCLMVLGFISLSLFSSAAYSQVELGYPIVDTGQELCYNNEAVISCPSPGGSFYGQDAQYAGNEPSYTLSGDGLTVYDNVTGLTWQQTPDTEGDGDIDIYDKLTWTEVQAYPAVLNAESYGGFNDWRVPTIKELYSLIKFNGLDPSAPGDYSSLIPFMDSTYFQFAYGDTLNGERIIDVQYASCNLYVDGDMGGGGKLFGVNFADGRIKGYGLTMPGMGDKTFLLLCVRGNTEYGENNFADNGDGTITDSATGLMWQKGDSEAGLNWQDALDYAENLNLAGYDDWRLPNAKELQSIVDYTRAPITTASAAIDPIFDCSSITNEAGRTDWPYFWTSTSHVSLLSGDAAAYVCFGTGPGWMRLMGNTYYSYVDVHGAGCQRSEPKSGSPSSYLVAPGAVDSLGNPVYGRGPQGDVIRIYNYVRCVREGLSTSVGIGYSSQMTPEFELLPNQPNPFNSSTNIIISCNEPNTDTGSIEIFDLSGRKIRSLSLSFSKNTNIQKINWDGINDANEEVNSGVYFYVVDIGGIKRSSKMLFIK